MLLESRRSVIQELGFADSRWEALNDYVGLLWASNEELNLISRKMILADLIDNHVVDCLLPLRLFPASARTVADFGSGGGLPGVLYAIQYPDRKFSLYEKSPKKREFLERCRKIAPNLEVLGEIPRNFGRVDLVISRAFKPIDVILEMSRDYFASQGKYFLLKGRRERIEEELTVARKKFKSLNPKIEVLHSPLLAVERHLVVI